MRAEGLLTVLLEAFPITWAKRAMAAMAAAREAMDCSMRAWLALPMALPSADAAAFAACRYSLPVSGPHHNAQSCRVWQQQTEQLTAQAHKGSGLPVVVSALLWLWCSC